MRYKASAFIEYLLEIAEKIENHPISTHCRFLGLKKETGVRGRLVFI